MCSLEGAAGMQGKEERHLKLGFHCPLSPYVLLPKRREKKTNQKEMNEHKKWSFFLPHLVFSRFYHENHITMRGLNFISFFLFLSSFHVLPPLSIFKASFYICITKVDSVAPPFLPVSTNGQSGLHDRLFFQHSLFSLIFPFRHHLP